MTLKVQEYLLCHTLDELAKEHGVYARFSKLNPKKLSLTYDQIEAKDGNPIVEECRGLVLQKIPCGIEEDDHLGCEWCSDGSFGPTKVLAFPFKRFYNYGQGAAANIDWDSAKFFEKLDGTLCIVYYDPTLCVWSVATRSVPDADLPLESGKTFADLFEQAVMETFGDDWNNFCSNLTEGRTYMFELCTPENEPNCIRHPDYRVWLLGIRDNKSCKEMIPHPLVGWPTCPSYNLTFEKMLDFVAEREPTKYEGLVVCDKDFNRIKIKNPAYVAMSKIKDKLAKSPRAFLELILMEKDDDVYPLLPEDFQKRLTAIKEKLYGWRTCVVQHHSMMLDPTIMSRKEIALKIGEWGLNSCMGVIMHILYADKGTVTSWIHSHKNDDGSYPDKFLDNLLKMIEA